MRRQIGHSNCSAWARKSGWMMSSMEKECEIEGVGETRAFVAVAVDGAGGADAEDMVGVGGGG